MGGRQTRKSSLAFPVFCACLKSVGSMRTKAHTLNEARPLHRSLSPEMADAAVPLKPSGRRHGD